MNTSYIGSLTVSSRRAYIVYGSVRGLVSEHRTLTGAERSLAGDQRGCMSQHGYSDASVYEWTQDGWKVCDTSI